MDTKRLKKRSQTLPINEFFYSISLQFRYRWLWERSNQLDETIMKVINPIGGAKRLFRRLVRRFKYVDRAHSQAAVDSVAHHIKTVWNCNPETTIIMPVCSKSHKSPDGSSKLIYDLRNALKDWKGEMVVSFFDENNAHILSGCSVILCDDFIGSGNTMERRIARLRDKMSPEAQIYVVSLAIMRVALDSVLNEKGVSSYAPLVLEKGINEVSGEKIMLRLETLLAPKYNNETLEKCSLGYAKVGSLYFNEDYRIPNNVYPVFWWGLMADGKQFNSIFMRP